MARKKGQTQSFQSESYFDKISTQVESNQSKLTMVLGGLIILVVVILLFNYFNRSKPAVGPSQQTQEDVSPENLPGKYTVKEDDTLFTIAEKYYQDGYKYTEIAQANNMANPDSIEVGQQLEIPKLADQTLVEVSPQPTVTPEETSASSPTQQPTAQNWGSKITSDTYTVSEGDWLSIIAARAYNGDFMAYTKLAQVNNIQNPDLIYPGTVLTIPR